MTEMDVQIIRETISSIKEEGYRFIIRGPKFDKQIIMEKGGKGIILYKGYFDRGQKWNSQQGSFRLAEKINKVYKREGRLLEVTPALLRSHIIDAAETIAGKKVF